jgi:hypothetical protein
MSFDLSIEQAHIESIVITRSEAPWQSSGLAACFGVAEG